ncbi:TPA: hypothetical protein HA361_02840 [Candidatus Woesearchaeota archaeon]|nr:hypothetical protein [Candidatus Woesearchaeota archaeon]HII68557.1 hypothetical protein [Candidatus Woesearchaeota archaeon]
MVNSIVSVRIPKSLLEEFRSSSKGDHFMDISEAVRSVIRDNWAKHRDPAAFELQKLRKDIADNLAAKQQEKVIAELEKLRESLIGSNGNT